MVVLLLSLISFKLLWCWTSFSLWQWTCYLCLTSVINLSTVKCLCTYTFTWTPYSCPSHRCVLFQSAFFFPFSPFPAAQFWGRSCVTALWQNLLVTNYWKLRAPLTQLLPWSGLWGSCRQRSWVCLTHCIQQKCEQVFQLVFSPPANKN